MNVIQKFSSFIDVGKSIGKNVNNKRLPIVCVQGMGFVGAAMAAAVAKTTDLNGIPYYNVIGVDLPSQEGKRRINAINNGKFPFNNLDPNFLDVFRNVKKQGNLIATDDSDVFSIADIAIVDVNLDLEFPDEGAPVIKWVGFKNAISALGRLMKPGTLIIIETTVPPGTCEKIAVPIIEKELAKRGFSKNSIMVAHSYERVMPGKDYLDSIINFWRVYAGHTEIAADSCEKFLNTIINTKEYPLYRLQSTLASETAKVLENSYRATNIAFIEEWGRFAEDVGVDLFEIIEAIRYRPTHNNIKQPGFGVGGYCLPKDPLLPSVSYREFFPLKDNEFPFSRMAVEINNKMPLASLRKIKTLLGETLINKRILLFGVSYRSDIGDTRFSPAQIFVEAAIKEGAEVDCYDPLIRHWDEMGMSLPESIPSANGYDAAVFALSHEEFLNMDIPKWLNGAKPVILDANNVLNKEQKIEFKNFGCQIAAIGSGLIL